MNCYLVTYFTQNLCDPLSRNHHFCYSSVKQSRRKNPRKKRRGSVENAKSATSEGGCGHWGHGLPVEILKQIFELVVQDEGSVPFLIR